MVCLNILFTNRSAHMIIYIVVILCHQKQKAIKVRWIYMF